LAPDSRFALAVQVISAEGKPIPGAKLDLIPRTQGVSVADEQPTDAQGSYTFSGLYQDQVYNLVATMDGFNECYTTVQTKPPVGAMQLKKITLVPANGTISGSVIKDSLPRPGVRIELHGGWQNRQTTTDAAGRFRFDHADLTQTLMIRAVADWGTSAWQMAGDGKSEVRISFDP